MATSSDSSDRFQFQIAVDNFDGPIDLLLHLVKKNELEICTLSLSQVCEQYLAYIQRMRDLDLDIASEYLVIAATLVSIKSNLILAKPVELVEDEFGNLVDPYQELLQRLREAAVYKEAAVKLDDQEKLNYEVFAPQTKLKQYEAIDLGLADHESFLLMKAFNKALSRLDDHKVYEVVMESVSIVDRMNYVMDSLAQNLNGLTFFNLISDQKTKANLIGTFLALLELCKRQVISVSQSDDEVYLKIATEDRDRHSLESEYDSSFKTQEVV